MRSKYHAYYQCNCKWGSLCADIQKQIATFCYEKEVNHPLLGCARIKNHQKGVKENMQRHLSNEELPLNFKEPVIARHNFQETLMSRTGNNKYVLLFDTVEKLCLKLEY